MATAAAMHDRFKEFLTSVDIRLRETEPPVSRAGQPAAAAEAAAARVEKWGAEERALAAVLQAKRAEVHEALCDAVDTGGALRALEQLLRETNRCAARAGSGLLGGRAARSAAQWSRGAGQRPLARSRSPAASPERAAPLLAPHAPSLHATAPLLPPPARLLASC